MVAAACMDTMVPNQSFWASYATVLNIYPTHSLSILFLYADRGLRFEESFLQFLKTRRIFLILHNDLVKDDVSCCRCDQNLTFHAFTELYKLA